MKNPEIKTNTTPEVKTPYQPDIPKSREIFTGDINHAVIVVQHMTGFEVTPEWWGEKVGNHGSTEDILDRFDAAFESFVNEKNGVIAEDIPSEAQIIDKADSELAEFDEKFGNDPGIAPLRAEFIEELEGHLKEKYFSEEDQQKIAFEEEKLKQIIDQYPESEQHASFSEHGIDVVACGRELSEHEAAVIRGAVQKISEQVGVEEAERLFGGVKLYVGEGLIEGGGLALPRFNAVAINLVKIGTTVNQMEEMLSKTGEYRLGDQSKLVENPDEHEAMELCVVHEFGHILEYKLHGDVDVAFAQLDQAGAPTEYGAQSAREDFAESFMYYIYDPKQLDERRRSYFETPLQ